MIIFSVCIGGHDNHTHFKHVLLGIFSVGKKLHEQSGAKAIGHSWKVHLHCPPVPAATKTSHISTPRHRQGRHTRPTNILNSSFNNKDLYIQTMLFIGCDVRLRLS